MKKYTTTFFSATVAAAAKILLAILIALNIGTIALAAHEEVTLTVKNPDPYTGNQSWFVYTKNPGALIEDVATIKNYGTTTSNVRIYPVDATTTQSGSYILKFDHEDQLGIGEWTNISRNEIKIAPGERIDVPFSVKLPADISPGQYIGGIVIEYGPNTTDGITTNCENTNTCGNSVVAVRTRIGSRIYITVPGEAREKIDFSGFSYYTTLMGQARFKFTIVNGGNVVYEPVAEITIRDDNGKIYDKFTKPLGTSAPGSTIESVITWDKQRPMIANFTATAKVTFPHRFQIADDTMHGSAMEKTADVPIFPWDHVFYLSVIALIVTTLCAMHGIRPKPLATESEKYQVRDNDDLISIASAKNTNWQTLADFNNLKQPYILKKGTVIFVPKQPGSKPPKNNNEKNK